MPITQQIEICAAKLMLHEMMPTIGESQMVPFSLDDIAPQFCNPEHWEPYLDLYAAKCFKIQEMVQRMNPVKKVTFNTLVIACLTLPQMAATYNRNNGRPPAPSPTPAQASTMMAGIPREQEEITDGHVDTTTSTSASASAKSRKKGGSGSGNASGNGNGSGSRSGSNKRKKPSSDDNTKFTPVDINDLPIPPCWLRGTRLFIIKPLMQIMAAICWRNAKIHNYRQIAEVQGVRIIQNGSTHGYHCCKTCPPTWPVLICRHPPLALREALHAIDPSFELPKSVKCYVTQTNPEATSNNLCGCYYGYNAVSSAFTFNHLPPNLQLVLHNFGGNMHLSTTMIPAAPQQHYFHHTPAPESMKIDIRNDIPQPQAKRAKMITLGTRVAEVMASGSGSSSAAADERKQDEEVAAETSQPCAWADYGRMLGMGAVICSQADVENMIARNFIHTDMDMSILNVADIEI